MIAAEITLCYNNMLISYVYISIRYSLITHTVCLYTDLRSMANVSKL